LEYVEDMTWREFQLRRLGFDRENKVKWEHTRDVSYYALAATGAIDTKKVSKEKFFPIYSGITKKGGGITDRGKDLLMKAINEVVNGGQLTGNNRGVN